MAGSGRMEVWNGFWRYWWRKIDHGGGIDTEALYA